MKVTKFINWGRYGDYEDGLVIYIADKRIVVQERAIWEAPEHYIFKNEEDVDQREFTDSVLDIMGNHICGDEKLQHKILSLCDPNIIKEHV